MAQRAAIGRAPVNRIPPHNVDAELSVLGAMLESKEAIANVIEIVQPEDFYQPAHTAVYEAILHLYGAGQPADAVTVADELNRRSELDAIGGRPYILGLLEAYPTASSAGRYARIVEEHALLRRLIDAGNQVQEIGFAIPEDVAAAVDHAEELVYAVGDRRLRNDVQPIHKLLVENMEAIEALYDRGEHVTGLASGFPDLDEKTAGFQPSNLIIVAARPSMGKCGSGGTLLVDPETGERVTLKSFVDERRSNVLTAAADGSVVPARVSDWIESGIQECWRLTTRTGRSIDVTAEHPFLTVSGWRPLSDLRPGSRIATPRVLRACGSDRTWSLERVRLLGYYIAEGGLTKTQPFFTNVDAVIRQDFEHCIDAEFVDCSIRYSGWSMAVRAKRRRKQPNSVTLWLRDLGLMGKRAEHKRFPDRVWRFDRERLACLLAVLFSCDGTIYSVAGYPRIEFAVASQGLAEDVHHALLRFGIIAKLWRKTERCWRVEITDPSSVDRYQRDIGWIGDKTHRDFRLFDKPRRANCGHVPRAAWELVRKALEVKGMSLSELACQSSEAQNLHTTRHIPQRRLARYAEILNSDDLRWLANEDLYWDEVVSIDPVGPKETYDLTVPDGSNFVAQDICVHNSALMGDFALHAAVGQKAPVVIFSLEMSRHEMVQRFLASQAKVDSQRLRRGSLQEQDWTRLSAALGKLAEAPIFIDDSATVTLMEIRAKCRRLKAKYGLGLILIDYLQLMQGPSKSENRQQEVSEISRNLKILARDLEVPVVCASQLNRGVEARHDKRPLLGDLRESGAIEQDADLVMFLYRDEVYNPDTEQKGEAELHLAKHRNGPTGNVRLVFMNQYTRFASLSRGTGF
ncbi:MAG: replicative DNA helicase [Actinomycetota bacterium]